MHPTSMPVDESRSHPQDDVERGAHGNSYDALDFLAHAAQESAGPPSSPESGMGVSRRNRRHSLSPIRKVRRPDSTTIDPAEQTSDEEANLVVVENPDGSLLEGMPSGFKHLTPEPSHPHTPRTLNFALTGVDLVELFNRHERIFLGLLLITVLVDAVIITEEFTTIIGAIVNMTARTNGSINWSGKLGNVLPFMEKGIDVDPAELTLAESHVRQTFSVFPPHWSFGWAFGTAWVDLFVCLIFFVAGFFAYVSKQRRSYSWFSTVACVALVWQVVLSCVDKLSLLLFLTRLACFTHARFMGDLMDDISVLATLMGPRGVDITDALLDAEQYPLMVDIAEEGTIRGRPPL